jgi:hypothetical protein
LAEAGCSANEIAAITGHTTLQEVSRYTKAAEQRRIAQAAMNRLQQVDLHAESQTPDNGLGMPPDSSFKDDGISQGWWPANKSNDEPLSLIVRNDSQLIQEKACELGLCEAAAAGARKRNFEGRDSGVFGAQRQAIRGAETGQYTGLNSLTHG